MKTTAVTRARTRGAARQAGRNIMISLTEPEKASTPKIDRATMDSRCGSSPAALLPAGIFLVTCVAFWPALQGDFAWDDDVNLVANLRFRGLRRARSGGCSPTP